MGVAIGVGGKVAIIESDDLLSPFTPQKRDAFPIIADGDSSDRVESAAFPVSSDDPAAVRRLSHVGGHAAIPAENRRHVDIDAFGDGGQQPILEIAGRRGRLGTPAGGQESEEDKGRSAHDEAILPEAPWGNYACAGASLAVSSSRYWPILRYLR